MPSGLLESVITMDVGAQEPWPSDVKLFQPYAIEQILLPDNANCLAVQAYLHMCGLPFQIEHRGNAEFMSPSGKVPFIKCGAFVVSELEPIVQFISNKGISLTGELDQEQKSDMRAYMSIIHTVLVNAELYLCWCDKRTYNEITKPRNGSVYPWPLNHILTWSKKASVIKKLKVLGWYQKTMDEIYQEVENCCQALSERLEGKDYFFGSKPMDVDALLFGHLSAILSPPYYSNELLSLVIKFPNLLSFCKRISATYNIFIDFYKLSMPEDSVEFLFNDAKNMTNDSELKIDYSTFVNHTDSNSTFNNGHIEASRDSMSGLLRNSLSCINFLSNIGDTKSTSATTIDCKYDALTKPSDDTLNNIISIENSQSDIHLSYNSDVAYGAQNKHILTIESNGVREQSRLNVSSTESMTSKPAGSALVAKEKKMQINISSDSNNWDSVSSDENKFDSSGQPSKSCHSKSSQSKSSHDSLSLELERRILEGKIDSEDVSMDLSFIDRLVPRVDESAVIKNLVLQISEPALVKSLVSRIDEYSLFDTLPPIVEATSNENLDSIEPNKKEYIENSKDTSLSSLIFSEH